MLFESAAVLREPEGQFAPGASEQGSTHEDCSTQRRRFAPACLWGRLGLVEREQVEAEDRAQKRRLRREELPRAKPARVQVVFQFFDALLDGRPLVVIAPKQHGVFVAIGHPHAERVAGHVQQAAAHGGLVLALGLAHDDEAPRVPPAVQLCGEAAHGKMRVDFTPHQRRAVQTVFELPGEPRDDDVGQPALLQKSEQRLVEKPRIRAHRAHPPALRQKRQRLLQKSDHPAPRRRIPGAKPSV